MTDPAEPQKPSSQTEMPGKAGTLELLTDFQSVAVAPIDPQERAHASRSLSIHIILWTTDRLGDRDKEEFRRWASDLPATQSPVNYPWDLHAVAQPVARRIFQALDEIILEQARAIGIRVWLSDVVLNRMAQWEEELKGAELYEQFGKELALRINVSRGKKRASLDPKMRAFKDDVKKEYSHLQKVLRSRDGGRRPLTFDDLLSLAEGHIKANSRAFQRLAANLTLFRAVVQKDNEWLTQRNMTPAMFAQEFLAVATNRSAESLRQELSRMPHRKL